MDTSEQARLEDIHYRICRDCESVELERAITRAMARLPDDVVDFACEHCFFVTIGSEKGKVLPGKIGVDVETQKSDNQWIIILDYHLSAEKAEEVQTVVAHEIAHAWLGHDRLGTDVSRESEVEAANLTAKWGFKGTGSDPDFCSRGLR